MLLFEMRIPPDLLALSALRKDVAGRLQSLAPNDSVRQAILLTISEMGANMIAHGHPEPSYLLVRLSLEGTAIVIEIEDDGGAFENFQTRVAQSMLKSAHLFAESGRGLDIIHSMLDEMGYEAGNPNRFTGKKHFSSGKPAILLVEDNPTLLATYAAMLGRDYHVLRSGSLEEALRLGRTERIDAIVTDLHLSERQGSELAELLEEDLDRPPIPVLVVSAERDAQVLARTLEAGVEQVLSKPVSAEALRGAVAAMLARKSRQHARLFRYFGGGIDQEGEDRLPTQVGPFTLRAVNGRAGFGRGDFICALRRTNGRRIVVADVMGHGLAAQIAGMRFKAALRAIHGAYPDQEPGDFLAALSRALCREPVLPGSFLTLMVVDLLHDGMIGLAAAGHPRAFIAYDGILETIETDGPLPGLFEEAEFPTVWLPVLPGLRLIVPTDGIDPKADEASRCLLDWLATTVIDTGALAFTEAVLHIEQEARRQMTPSPPDDWTLLIVEHERQNAESQLLVVEERVFA